MTLAGGDCGRMITRAMAGAEALRAPVLSGAPSAFTGMDPDFGDTLLNFERDRLGSMRRSRAEDMSAVTQREYGPYGETYSNNGPSFIFGYTGHILVNSDADYPTYYAPFRMYSPDSARWTSPDPLGMVDGPNVYGYVHESPIRGVDPLGLRLYWPGHPADPYHKWDTRCERCVEQGPPNWSLAGYSSARDCTLSILGEANEPAVECELVGGVIACVSPPVGVGIGIGMITQYAIALN